MRNRLYSTLEVAKLLKVPQTRIRAYVHAGVVTGGRAELTPHGRGAGQRLRFDFRDVLVLKTARRLQAAGLTPARIRRALTSLRRQLPEQAPLTAASIELEGGRVVVSHDDVTWEPESGQARLRLRRPDERAAPGASPAPGQVPVQAGAETLAQQTLAEVVHAKKRAPASPSAPMSAKELFELGLRVEEEDPSAAYDAYLRALARDPEHIEAMINIGRLCAEMEDNKRASAYFRQAIRTDPTHPVAHFNLAVTLHDMGEREAAQASYRTALLHDPNFADAHYNLAMLLEEMGEHAAAAAHLQAYRVVINDNQR